MKQVLFLIAGLVLALLLVACGNSGQESTKHPGQASNAPFDAQFIDSMIQHHQGAIDMARQAQTQAQHSEIKTLANAIITDQQREILKMKNWRKQWYPNLPLTKGMGMHMGDMKISEDTSKPFDQRFLEAMISHHQGAIDMANEAKNEAQHQQIKDLAAAIITAQTKEIGDMKQWQSQWYGSATPSPAHSMR